MVESICCTAAHLRSRSLNIVSLSDMIEGSYRSWDLYTTGQLVDGLQKKKKKKNTPKKPVFIKRKWNHVVFSRATILSFHHRMDYFASKVRPYQIAGRIGPKSDGNEEVLHISHISRNEVSLSDQLSLIPRYSGYSFWWEMSYLSPGDVWDVLHWECIWLSVSIAIWVMTY